MVSGYYFFSSPVALYAFYVVYGLWVVAETGLSFLSAWHKGGAVGNVDRGSYLLIVVGIVTALGVAYVGRGAGIGILPAWVAWPGLMLMLLGIALRSWAVLLLGRFFGAGGEPPQGQHVVTAGPYRYIRHPAYAGTLITLAALGLAVASWPAALFIVLVFGAIYTHRARAEEALLTATMGDEYRAYAQRTGRLVPLLGRTAGKAVPAAPGGGNQ